MTNCAVPTMGISTIIQELDMDEDPVSQNVDINVLKEDMIDFISHDNRPYFKSQQIGDADLTTRQKKEIATELFNKSKSAFLSRFGLFLTSDHLLYFENNTDSDKYETEFLLRQIRRFNVDQKRNTDVRNRRYEAMKKLISENVYFTETEMMSREPLLYDQLVGKYLSEHERLQRDEGSREPNSTFVNVLLNGIEKNIVDDLRTSQFNDEEAMVEEEDEDDIDSGLKHNTTVTYTQWGEMTGLDKPPDVQHSFSNTPEVDLTSTERALLREEFVSAMYSNFLDGKDRNFDYSLIDYNSEYDNVDIRAQDEEEKYFDEEDPEEMHQIRVEEDDELDIYMKHLALHPSLRK